MANEMLNNRIFDRRELPMVRIIDALCGAGKTSYVINEINSNDTPVVYCTESRDEADRIGLACDKVISLGFGEHENDDDYVTEYKEKYGVEELPTFEGTYGIRLDKEGNIERKSKTDIFIELLEKGESIAITHKLLREFNEECYRLIKKNGYRLYLDEVFNTVDIISSSPHDIEILFNEGLTKLIPETNEVVWAKDDYTGDFDKKKKAIQSGDVYLAELSDRKQLLVCEMSICKFIYFTDVTITTYQFVGSQLSRFFDINKVPYTVYSMKDHSIVPYDIHTEDRESIRKLINLYDGSINYNINGTLSYSCYEKLRKNNKKLINDANKKKKKKDEDKISSVLDPVLKKIKANADNYFKNIVKAKNDTIMWSCYKDDLEFLKGRKCTSKSHVTYNIRATNKYRNKTNLAYLVNPNVKPDVRNYFAAHDANISEDLYALSTLLQWIFRSALRDGKPVNLYLPSERMRDLLDKWMNYEI